MTTTANAAQVTTSVDFPSPSQVRNTSWPTHLALARHLGCGEVPGSTIHVVDHDDGIRDALTDILEEYGYVTNSFASGELLLQSFHPGDADCLLVDEHMPALSGIETLARIRSIDPVVAMILITENATLNVSIQAMKAGAVDFIQKPFKSRVLIESIETALTNARRRRPPAPAPAVRASHGFLFTNRQREILERVLDGQPSKNIAADLGISQRTVENHRAAIMRKTGSKSIPQLVRTTFDWMQAD